MTETNSEAPSPATQYKVVLFRLKLVRLVCFLLNITPWIFYLFATKSSSIEEAISMAYWFLTPIISGWLIYLIFLEFFWKCPNCGRFPGNGTSYVICKHCKTRLC